MATIIKINCGKGLVLDVDTDKFNDEVYDHCFRLGLKTALRNVHAGVESEQESNQRSRDKLESFYAGQVHRPGGNGFAEQVAAKDAKIAELEARLAALSAAAKPPSTPPAPLPTGVVRGRRASASNGQK